MGRQKHIWSFSNIYIVILLEGDPVPDPFQALMGECIRMQAQAFNLNVDPVDKIVGSGFGLLETRFTMDPGLYRSGSATLCT